jgi:hypothetical protein
MQIDAAFYFENKEENNPFNSYIIDYQQILDHISIPDDRTVIIFNSISLIRKQHAYFKADYFELSRGRK